MYVYYWKNSTSGATTSTVTKTSPGRFWYRISRVEFMGAQSAQHRMHADKSGAGSIKVAISTAENHTGDEG